MTIAFHARAAALALLCVLPLAGRSADLHGHPPAPMPADAAGAGESTAENRGMDCDARPLPPGSDARLPDPFVQADGARLASRSQWRCHRQSLLLTAEDQVYGWKGPRPERVTGTVHEDRIEVAVRHGDREVGFGARLRLPPGPGPHPAMIVLGGVGGIDDRLLAEQGVARIDFLPTEIGAETGQSRERRGAFFELYGPQVSGTGTLMAWAWGVSRLLDAIAQSGVQRLRADAVGVTGCSRLGKGALAVGAFDQRVALTVPIESGAGGVPVWRAVGAAGAQPAHSAYGEQPWLGDTFADRIDAVERLAIDQHTVLGLVAPRGLLILDNPHVAWLGARAGHVGALAGAEVYRALGAAGNLGYYSAVQDGTHCAWRPEWDAPARQALRRHLRHAAAGDLAIDAADAAADRLDDHRAWETPALD